MLEIKDNFYLDGKPFKIISGAVHYFRTVPDYWQDRLVKLRNMGCNTVETYIPWNFHETVKGEFLWKGAHDVCRFIEIAQNLGLYIILRPSPYICAEWEFGGLPAWLLADKNMRLRCSYEPYLHAVEEYYSVLLPKLAPYQLDRGGRVILMQIENEYGYYGNDKAYLRFLRDTFRKYGITVPLVTSDGPWSEAVFRSGMVDGALATGNFGSSANWQFGQMKRFVGEDKPMMCMEFWNGWFDAWGEEHHTTPPEKAAAELEELLRLGHVNFYMFEGGTNFGFMSGRNGGSKTCDVTSYDYDSPLTEDGRITPKYKLFQDVIAKFADVREKLPTAEIKRREYGAVSCAAKVGLLESAAHISPCTRSVYPVTMEEIGQNYGYILYRLQLGEDESAAEIALENAADRVQCFENGKLLFTRFGDDMWEAFKNENPEKGAVIDLLCENHSRENFGTGLENQRKGISGGVKINGRRHFGYEIFPLEFDENQLAALDFSRGFTAGAPAFYKFDFTVDECCDTFLQLDGFGKGCAFVNGFNLGRYWEIGPQKRLYIPAPLLKKGENSIVVFESEGRAADEIYLCAEPKLS